MYSIKQASIRSGVGVPLIRAWERRYGTVAPKRTASGYRLYDDEAIATLVRIRELTEEGWSASEASRAVLAGEVPIHVPPSHVPVLTAEEAAHSHRDDLVERFIGSAAEMDITATAAVLDEMLALGSFEAIVDDLLMPALVELGRAWSNGRLDVAAEHAASAAVYRRLSALFEAASVVGEPGVVVGLPPGARHELGALAFSVAVRRLGVGVLYLGPDVPASSWVHVIERHHSRVAVLGIVQRSEQAGTLEVVDAIRAAGHQLILAVGGKHARWEAAAAAGITVLPDRIIEAARVVARLATGTRTAGAQIRESAMRSNPRQQHS